MIVLTKVVVGARLDQLSCSGEEAALLDALSCPTVLKSIEFARVSKFPKWIGWYYLVGYAFIIIVVASITYF